MASPGKAFVYVVSSSGMFGSYDVGAFMDKAEAAAFAEGEKRRKQEEGDLHAHFSVRPILLLTLDQKPPILGDKTETVMGTPCDEPIPIKTDRKPGRLRWPFVRRDANEL